MRSLRLYYRATVMLAWLWFVASSFAFSENDSAAVDRADSVDQANIATAPVKEADEVPAPPFWMEFYSEGANEPSENNNPNGYLEVKIGKRIKTHFPIDLYTKVRAEDDRDHYFWHNRDDAGVGGRFYLLTEKASLSFMTEGTIGRFIPDRGALTAFENTQTQLTQFESQFQDVSGQLQNDAFLQTLSLGNNDSLQRHIDALSVSIYKLQNYIDSLQQITDSIKAIPASNVTDLKAGFVFYKGWGNNPDGRIFPLRSWGDVYADLIFLSSWREIQVRGKNNYYHNTQSRYANLIASFSPKIGIVLIEGLLGSVVVYAEGNCLVDLRGDWYNNLGWVAGGLRYKPFSVIDLNILAEYDAGSYWGRQYKDDANPNKQTFMNFRLGINLWYGAGN